MGKKEAAVDRLIDCTIFTYSISHLSATDKVRFYYALKGRGGDSGIISDLSIKQLGKTVLLADSCHLQKISEFLSQWKCPFSNLPVMIRSEEAATTNSSGLQRLSEGKRILQKPGRLSLPSTRLDSRKEVIRTP